AWRSEPERLADRGDRRTALALPVTVLEQQQVVTSSLVVVPVGAGRPQLEGCGAELQLLTADAAAQDVGHTDSMPQGVRDALEAGRQTVLTTDGGEHHTNRELAQHLGVAHGVGGSVDGELLANGQTGHARHHDLPHFHVHGVATAWFGVNSAR
ncbi:MAG TPA: hypothetical protein VFZ48_00100, partial [Candidatus Saccharimonadales bacterium]